MGLLGEVLHVNDMYGYYAHLNLNKKHDAHNTHCGGFFSIIAKMCIIGFIILRLQIMFRGHGDENSSQTYLLTEAERVKEYRYEDI